MNCGADDSEPEQCRDVSGPSWWPGEEHPGHQRDQPCAAFDQLSQGVFRFWFLLCVESSGYCGTDQFSLSEKHQIFHTSQTELFVTKIAHLRLIYLPFQGPDMRMSTLASVAHERTGWKILFHNLPPKTIPISAAMFTEGSLQLWRGVRARLLAGCLGDHQEPCLFPHPGKWTSQSLLQTVKHMDALI